jgi:leucyl/phenylalanyl-tRNA--protein transferase
MADACVSQGRVSLVLGGAADPLVGAGSARGALPRRVSRLAQPLALDREARIRDAHRHAFNAVIEACAGPRRGTPGTWITRDMHEAYVLLHRRGLAHSFETWHDGRLVGGLYGVGLGRMFFGESMFTRETDASKVALARLVAECRARNVPLIDCQMASPHLASLGSRSIPRWDFEARLAALVDSRVPVWRETHS